MISNNFCYFEGYVGKNIYFNKERTMCAFQLSVKKYSKDNKENAYDYLKFKAFKEMVEKLYLDLEEGSVLSVQCSATVETREKDGVKTSETLFIINSYSVKYKKGSIW